jgi:hypothetical protein
VIDILIELGLISKVGMVDAKRNNEETPLSEFTNAGIFMGLLVSVNNHGFSPKANIQAKCDDIFPLMQASIRRPRSHSKNKELHIMGEDNSSKQIMGIMLHKIREKNLFPEFVRYFIQDLHGSDPTDYVISFEELLYFNSRPFSRLGTLSYWDIWYESFSELNPTTRKLLLHIMKLDIEKMPLVGFPTELS